jgi:hypothetical protein
VTEKQAADETREKALRRQLRRLGFHISDFTADAGGLVESDIDALIARGVITIEEPPVSSERETLERVSRDWFWEGTVQDALVAYLVSAGWVVERTADTASREQGIDVLAIRDGRRLAVEVKGFPSAQYAGVPKAGQPKPTAPSLRARHWFASAAPDSDCDKGKGSGP